MLELLLKPSQSSVRRNGGRGLTAEHGVRSSERRSRVVRLHWTLKAEFIARIDILGAIFEER